MRVAVSETCVTYMVRDTDPKQNPPSSAEKMAFVHKEYKKYNSTYSSNYRRCRRGARSTSDRLSGKSHPPHAATSKCTNNMETQDPKKENL